jgi:hypothetical protein
VAQKKNTQLRAACSVTFEQRQEPLR